MYRLILLLILMLGVLLPFSAAAAERGTVPTAADTMVSQIDNQLMRKIGTSSYGRNSVSIAITVPVNLGNLHQSSPLARQVAEEMTTLLVNAGYNVEDIRKGKDILMQEGVGEMLLTRDMSQLASRDVTSVAVLTGTYTVTANSVRFNLRLLHTPSNQVLASAAATVPVTNELFPLLADRTPGPTRPTVATRLN